ncbi:MAG: TerB family tellurite resistance protein [Paracoccaceae bacterium]|nr:TerB family tellurite resistance protein [Paracoccaceae bacterium]
MFEALLRRLVAPAPARLPAPEANLALAALLVRLARADGDYSTAEIARIDRVLAARHGFTDDSARALRERAEVLEAEAPDTVRFTKALKDAVPLEDRSAVVQAMWSVALADGSRDAAEDQVLRLVSNLLGLSDMESAQARQRAARG